MRSIITILVLVLSFTAGRNAAAKIDPEGAARLEAYKFDSRYDTTEVEHAVAHITLADLKAYPSVGNHTANILAIMMANEVTVTHFNKGLGEPSIHFSVSAKNGGTDAEKAALLATVKKVACWWGHTVHAKFSIGEIETRNGVVPLDASQPLGPSKDVVSLSCRVKFTAYQDLFKTQILIKAIQEIYGRPSLFYVNFHEESVDILEGYPFKVEIISLTRRD